MGWWRSDQNREDVIGDGPADVVVAALRSIMNSGGKPTLQELLDAISCVLRHAPGGLVQPMMSSDYRLGAVLTNPPSLVESTDAIPEPRIVNAIEGALHAIAAEYMDSVERLPRLSEVLATFAFVLRPASDRFLSESVQICAFQ